MNELLEVGQIFNVVPTEIDDYNKGKVIDIRRSGFQLELSHEPKGLEFKHMIELYSQTKNGTLFFKSGVVNVDGKVLTVTMPRKHRFLQRRAFTRVKFNKELIFSKDNQNFEVKAVDLAAGGLKIQSKHLLELDGEYEFKLQLLKDNIVTSVFEPVRIEKNDSVGYVVSGRFKNISDKDRMALIQFCLRKDTENKSR